MEQQEYSHTDTIDIRELIETITKRRTLIYTITGVMTLLAVLYAFVLAKPVYEVKAMIEIGKIEAGTKDETPLDKVEDIKQKLEYLYAIKSKKKKDDPRLKSIRLSKNSQSLLTIVVEGGDNKTAIMGIDEIVHKLEDDYAQKVNVYIDTQKKLIALTQNDIEINKDNLKAIHESLQNYNKKLLNITEKDAALAGLYSIQIGQSQMQMQELQSLISKLKTKAVDLKLSIAPLRITKTHIVGKVDVLDAPVKPKKALIVIVSFITAFMFSIFLVFFLEFLKGIREEE